MPPESSRNGRTWNSGQFDSLHRNAKKSRCSQVPARKQTKTVPSLGELACSRSCVGGGERGVPSAGNEARLAIWKISEGERDAAGRKKTDRFPSSGWGEGLFSADCRTGERIT